MKPAVVVSMCVVSIKIKHGNSGNVAETYALLDSCSQCTFMLERLIILKWKVEKHHWQSKHLRL